MTSQKRKPTLFDEQDKSLTITPTREGNKELSDAPINYKIDSARQKRGGVTGWLYSIGFWLISSLIGLIGIFLIASLTNHLETLFARSDFIGWTALGLALIAGIAFTLLIIREINGIWGLKKLARLQAQGRRAHQKNELKPARAYIQNLKTLYETAPSRAWMLKRFKEYEGEIMDGAELIELADKEIGGPLDADAREIIIATARKVSLITAIAPGPLFDMAAIALLNLAMIRNISSTYGTAPGKLGQMRLMRKVITHLALSGGLAITSDLIQPLIGTSLAAKLSKRFGEGVFNGALTIRLGLSAIELTRPIPHLVSKPQSFRALAAASLSPRA